MDTEAVYLLSPHTSMVHYRAEAHTPSRLPAIHLLGCWDSLTLAQQSCCEHDEAAPQLDWRRRCNGLWEAQGETHRHQIVLLLGPLA